MSDIQSSIESLFNGTRQKTDVVPSVKPAVVPSVKPAVMPTVKTEVSTQPKPAIPSLKQLQVAPKINKTQIQDASKFWKDKLKDVDDSVRAVASGITFSFADEFAAAMNSLITGESYETEHEKEIKRDKETHQGLRIAGEITGGIGTTLAAGPVIGAVKGGNLMVQMFSKMPKWLQATSLGSLWGGLFSAGSAERGIEKRLKNVPQGTVLGAAAGGALSTIGGGFKLLGGAMPLQSMLMGRIRPETEAKKILGKLIAEENLTTNRIRQRLSVPGREGLTILDVAGRQVKAAASDILRQGGATANYINMILASRAGAASSRIEKYITQALGPGDYFGAKDAMLASMKKNANKFFFAANQANPVIDGTTRIGRIQLNEFLRTDIGKKAIKRAAELAENERLAGGGVRYLGPVDEELTAAARAASDAGLMPGVGRPGVMKDLSLETWHYIKKGYESVLSTSDKYRTVDAFGGAKYTADGRSLVGVIKTLTRGLDKATGGRKSLYKLARQHYAGDVRMQAAMHDGLKFFNESAARVKHRMSKYNPSEKQAYRNAVARATLDRILKTPDKSDEINKIWGDAMMRKRFEAVFPSKGEFKEFARKMAGEQIRTKTGRDVTGKGAALSELFRKERGAVGSVGATTFPAVMPVGHELIQANIGRKIAEAMVGTPERMVSKLTKMILSKDPKEIEMALKAIEPYVEKGTTLHAFMRGLIAAQTPAAQHTIGTRE